MIESERVLKPGGQVLISSHLKKSVRSKSRSGSILETAIRLIHRLRNRVAMDDHTLEFESTKPIIVELEKLGLKLEMDEIFKNYFFLVARK